VKRPEQHETDSAADALFRGAFHQWAITPSERDYGWDHVVEVFRNGESTGLLFNGQLKGSRHTEYSADRSFISQELEIDSADYLARQLRQPTFLFHADVEQKKLFWSAIQLDRQVLEILEEGKTKSLTVRVPTANALPDRFAQFLEDLTRSHTVVVSRALSETTHIEFVEAMKSQPVERITKVAEDLHEKGYHLELQAAFDQRKSGDIAGAITAIRKVATSAGISGYIEVQFNAVLQAGELEWMQQSKSDEPQARAADRKLSVASELCHIAKRTPRHLHLFAQITRKAAELSVAVQKTAGLMMIWRGHQKRSDDPLWLAVLSFQLQESLMAAHKQYRQALRLAQATARSKYRWITSRPLVDVAIPIAMLAGLLESCGFNESAVSYRTSAFEILQFSAAVATENRNMDELFNAVMTARMIERDKNGEIFKWIRSIIDNWHEDSDYRKNAEELMERAIQRLDGATFEGEIKTNHRQIHHNILTSEGIDPTEEPWASLIDLAIKDDDPTRVLIDCEHKAVMDHPAGDPMLVRLGLERANPKMIGCLRYRYRIGGRTLDGINQEFVKRFCSTCLERSPRPAAWTFYDDPLPEK
jgi:hypothetical protein